MRLKTIILSIIFMMFTGIFSALASNKTNDASMWKEIDDLMQKPALTSAETALKKLDKIIYSKGTDADKLRSLVYHFAINYGCEFSLLDNKRAHYANNANQEEGEQIVLEAFVQARNLMLEMENRENKAIALSYMLNLINSYKGLRGYISETEISFENKNFKEPKNDKLGIWSETFKGDELDHYKAVRMLNVKELSELPYDNLKHLSTGIARELQSYVMTCEDKPLEHMEYMCKELGDKKIYTLLTDIIVKQISSEELFETHWSSTKPEWFNPWNGEWNLNKNGEEADEGIKMLYNQFKKHLTRKELAAAAHYFVLYGNRIYNNREHAREGAKNYVKAYQEACNKMIETLGNDESVVIVANRLGDLMLNEYNTECLPELMDQTLPQRIIDFCDKYIKKYPKSEGVEGLKATKEIVLRPRYNVEVIGGDTHHSNDSIKLKIRYANIDEIEVKLLKSDISNAITDSYSRNELIAKAKPVALKQNKFKLDKTNYYIMKFADITIADNLDYGYYYIAIKDVKEKDNEKTSYFPISISDILTYTIQNTSNTQIVYCVDRVSGHPIEGVSIDIINRKKNKTSTTNIVTDKNGRAVLTVEENSYLRALSTKGADKFSPLANLLTRKIDEASNYQNITINTDRSIYRPGQTIHIKAVAYETGETTNKVLANEKINIKIQDPNYKTVYKAEATTNEFGSAVFEYTTQLGKLNGSYNIYVATSKGFSNNASVKIEEYKRPKYEAYIDNFEGTLALGHEITINGVARHYSGEPLTNASAEVKIVKSDLWLRRSNNDEYSRILHATTDNEGRFQIKFTSERDKAEDSTWVTHRFVITGHVVAPTGEAVDFISELSVNSEDLNLDISANSNVFEMQNKIELYLSSFDFSGRENESQVTLSLINIDTKEKKVLDKYKDFTFSGKRTITIDPKSIGVGNWQIVANNDILDKYKVHRSVEFVVYDKNSETCPAQLTLWASTYTYYRLAPNEDFELYIASKEPDAKILVAHRINNDEMKSEKWVDLNNSMKLVKFKYSELFTNDNHNETSIIKLLITKNNKTVCKTIRVDKKPEQFNYPLTLKTYRDKVVPGSKEKWTLEFKAPEPAEVLALMYDASLDFFNGYYIDRISHMEHLVYGLEWAREYYNLSGDYYEGKLLHDSYYYNPAEPNWIWSNAINSNGRRYKRQASMMSTRATRSTDSFAYADNIEESVGAVEYELSGRVRGVSSLEDANKVAAPLPPTPKVEEGNPTASKPIVKIRENFKETAFFYPTLKTNSNDGLCTFEFEVPESLTEWKFVAYAHTKTLKTGEAKKTISTYQPVSIRASLPRFMRRGDKQSLVASIVKTESNIKSAKVYVKVTDAMTDKSVFESSKTIDLNGTQTTVNFMYSVPETLSAAIVEFMVEADNFKDGERHKLPVLNNCEHVIKSVNMIVKGGSEKNFDLPKADNGAMNKETTIQYSANAAWNVVTALPSAKEHTNNSISISSALYVNALAGNIAQTYPEIRREVQKWSETADNRHKKSALENDEQLKSIILEETPWVRDAEKEREWKNELVNTLDSERAFRECEKLVQELAKMQNEDGGFSWFPNDMSKSSYYTTLVVCETFNKLHQRGLLATINGAKEMYEKALKYIDKETVKNYEANKDKYVGEYDLHNMVIRISSEDVVKINGKVKDIYKDYLNYANKKWVDMTLYGKATLAIVNYKFGEKNLAKKILEAMRESYTKNDENGIYWKSNQDFSRIYSSAILRQALCIRAFAMIDPRAEEMEMMKQWLIVRKSRTMWESEIATVDAIDAVLFESNRITSSNINSTLTFGDVTLTASTSTGNEGFVQYTSKETNTPASINIKQADNAVGIGAAYISYDCKLDNITANTSGISVEKETYLLIPSKDNTKEVLKEIHDGDNLKVGDKVKVVLKVHNDQDLDFVTLKDRRPACFEPKMVMSGYRMNGKNYFYQSLKDASMSYMFDRLQKGVHVFEYESSVTHEGEYQSGTATIQCTYNPSYNANSTTEAIKVKSK